MLHHAQQQNQYGTAYAQQGDSNLSSSATNSPVVPIRSGRATDSPSTTSSLSPIVHEAIIELATPHNANVTYEDDLGNLTNMEREMENAASGVPGAGRPSGLMGQLRVTLHSCKNLFRDQSERGLTRSARQSPYVTMSIGRESIRSTTYKQGGLDPVFDQTFLFTLSGREDVMHIRVWDNKFLMDKAIARVDLPLTDIITKHGTTAYQCVDDTDLTLPLGIINLTTVYIPVKEDVQAQSRIPRTATATAPRTSTAAPLAAAPLAAAAATTTSGHHHTRHHNRDRNHDGIPDQYQTGVVGATTTSTVPRALDKNGDRHVDVFQGDRNHDGIPDSQQRGVGRDLNRDGIPDSQQHTTMGQKLAGVFGGNRDRNHDGIPDSQQRGYGQDLNRDGIPDSRQRRDRTGMDLNRDGIPDSQNMRHPLTTMTGSAADRNHDGIPDRQQNVGTTSGYRSGEHIPSGGVLVMPHRSITSTTDANHDGIPDSQQRGYAQDLNRDGIPDSQQRRGMDLNRDGIPDSQNLAHPMATGVMGSNVDRNHDGIPDRQQRGSGVAPVAYPVAAAGVLGHSSRTDRNHDGIPDSQQRDRNHDGIPDAQQHQSLGQKIAGVFGGNKDRNHDGIPDSQQRGVGTGYSQDLNRDGIPDSQQRGMGMGRDLNRDGIPDSQQHTTMGQKLAGVFGGNRDRNHDGIPDSQQRGYGQDLNRDGIPDSQQRDLNRDGIPDSQQHQSLGQKIAGAFQRDRNHDGIPDSQQRGTGMGYSQDLNRDGIPDSQQRRGTDLNRDGIPDREQYGRGTHDRDIRVFRTNDPHVPIQAVGHTVVYDQGKATSVDTTASIVRDDGYSYGQMDRNHDGIPDAQQRGSMGQQGVRYAGYGSNDLNRDGIPDQYQSGVAGASHLPRALDKNGDGRMDAFQRDRNHGGIPDSQQRGVGRDLNRDGIPDPQQHTTMGQKLAGVFGGNRDRNHDGIPDSQQRGYGQDLNRDGIPDSQQRRTGMDLNRDGIPDSQNMRHPLTTMTGSAADRNHDGIPDRQQYGGHQQPGYMSSSTHGTDLNRDLNRDGIPDQYQAHGEGQATRHSHLPQFMDKNRDGHMDMLQRDRNHDGIPDSQQQGYGMQDSAMTREPRTMPAPHIVPSRASGLNETQSLSDALRDGPAQQQGYSQQQGYASNQRY